MDDDELLAIFDSSGRHAGVKRRSLVHRDGDWHWVVFVLAARVEADGSKRFLLQLRGRPDDPFVGHLDALAGGHVAAGEGHLEGAVRECHEEVHVELREDELVYLGRRFLDSHSPAFGREIQHFYLCTRPLRLQDLGLTREVSGIVEVDLDEFEEFLDGTDGRIDAKARFASSGDEESSIKISWEHLEGYTAASIDGLRRALCAVRLFLDTGNRDPRLWT